MSKSKSNKICCVVGCTNTYKNTNNIKFYNFPNRSYEQEVKIKWIQAINRLDNNGKLWYPNKYSLICSAHFIGNERSKDPQSPSYTPKIFPEVYKKKSINLDQQCSRYHRIMKRQMNNEANDILNISPTVETYEGANCKSLCDASTQVTFECVLNKPFIFSCSFEGIAVGTQITSPGGFYDNNLKLSSDKSCGPDSSSDDFCNLNLNCDKFHGFDSIENELSLKDLTGTSFKVFDFLLSLLSDTHNSIINKKNRLLIFLMKIKLDLSFSALSVFFNVHRTTISRIFFNCLEILCFNTKNLIFWPSKHTIAETLPETFKKHYPNTRCIIDCTEIKVEQPPTVEQRVYLYSHYKGCYTVKFLAAITPSGAVSFISKCYGGRSSDSFITNDSGFLSKLEPGDLILADKGFPGIKTDCENNNTIVVMPPVLHNGRLSEEEVLRTYSIASVRIHIERFFARLKTYGTNL